MANLFERLFRRDTATRYIYVQQDDPVAIDLDLAALYKTQPNLQAVISYIADNIAQLPLKVYDRRDNNDRERVLDSPAAKLFGGHVNPDMTPFEYIRALVSNLALYGRHVDILLMDKDTPAGWQLRPIPTPWLTKYNGGTAFAPESITIAPPKSAVGFEVSAQDFILYHNYNPNTPSKALSPVSALRTTLAEQIEAERYRSQVWKRGGRVASVVSRPKDVEQFTPDQRARFMEKLREAWTGDFGSQAGGLMLLEDGMTIQPYQVNAHEAQWAEAKKLSREDVAAIYHINPKLIWPGDGQTYASAKDNARAFYADAVAPILKQIESRMNAFLLPKIGEPEGHYIEFDISGKLRGSFEEQAQVLYQAVGGPYMMPNEARGTMNLPSLGERFDSIYVPLNMTQVQANEGEKAAKVATVELELNEKAKATLEEISKALTKSLEETEETETAPLKYKAHPLEEEQKELTEIFRKFYERQRDSVLPKIGAKAEWWDADRWNDELTADLYDSAHSLNISAARRALEALGYELPYTDEEAAGFILAMCHDRAIAINDTTLEQLLAALESEGDGELDTPKGVFDHAIDERAESNGTTLATSVAAFSAIDAARVIKRETDETVTKTWIHNPSANPRPGHVAMDGETVPFDEPFSNGMQWPGDIRTGTVDEIANCHCEVEITRP